MKIAILVSLVTVGGLFAQTRPRDPFIFRAAINEGSTSRPNSNKNRLIAVLLNTGFTALYSTENGSLYMTRTGTATDVNSTYSQVVFGQIQAFSGGAVLHRNTTAQTWELLNNGSPVTSKTVYKGYSVKATVATLRYAIIAGASTINISEVPEYVAGGSGGIRRAITVSGLEATQSVRLRLSGQVATETWAVQSGGTISGTNPMLLTISANGIATVTGSWN